MTKANAIKRLEKMTNVNEDRSGNVLALIKKNEIKVWTCYDKVVFVTINDYRINSLKQAIEYATR